VTTLRAPAKLTWFLEVVGERADGYHLLRSEMVSLALADTLTIGEGDGLTITGLGAERLDAGPSNLVTKALALVGRRAAVTLHKAIPAGGGLGGGSSDAAAILRWAGFGDLLAASRLGGDVPFCLRGGRALVEGVGEQVTPLADVPRRVTLFLPSFGVNTAACYQAYDQLVRSGERPSGRNHLTAAACLVEPRLEAFMAFVASVTGREAVLAGSGSTVFVEGWGVGVPTGVPGPDGAIQVLESETVPAGT